MWRYIFLNSCFVILLIALLALQHSFSVFGPTGHRSAGTDSDLSQISELASNAKSPRFYALGKTSAEQWLI